MPETATADVHRSVTRAGELAGKYLTFHLGTETYGLEILKVQELIGLMPITSVPRTPDFVRGVINLRGKVIPVIELRRKFGIESTQDTERACIIVVRTADKDHEVTVGILVDEVSEVLDILEGQIEPAPEFGSGVEQNYILAMGKIQDKVVILLNVDAVLSKGTLMMTNSTVDAN